MNEFPYLLSSLRIGQHIIRNRILVSAHVPGFAINNKPSAQYIRYHQTYAENGVGLQITGGTPVHPSGLLNTSGDGLWNLDDSIIPGYRDLGQAVHLAGGKILAQLAHSAGTVLINQPGRSSWSASAIRSETTGNISHAMTKDEIKEIINCYVAAARRVKSGELDGVELLGAFGYLPQAFLSPLTNFRQDEYGGGLTNRLRFTMELLSSLRETLGSEHILGIRIPGDEFAPGGLTLDDMKIVAQRLSDSELVDYISVIAHNNITITGRQQHWPPTPAPHGLFIPLASAIKSVVGVPVFGIGRITSPHLAEKIVEDNQADMVGMTRANICDPELVKKVIQGEIKQIRPCVGANTCIANRYAGKPINCAHNASVSIPGDQLAKSVKLKTVAVIGAGPAGLEAARVAARRGHQVKIFEASSIAGGQLNLWSSIPSTAELQNIIHWRLVELQRLGVSIEFDRPVDSSNPLAATFDEIIFATGASAYTRSLPGSHKINIVSPHTLLTHSWENLGNAIILNEGRGQAGLVAAEFLLNQGAKVEIITTDIAVASDLDPTNQASWYTRLGKLGCTFTNCLSIACAEQNTIFLQNVYDLRSFQRLDIDLVVDWIGSKSNNNPLSKQSLSNSHQIGDCVTPRTLEIAIAEALNIGKKI